MRFNKTSAISKAASLSFKTSLTSRNLCILKLVCGYPSSSFSILNFAIDHHFSTSINKLDIITQAATFLGIICTVIMGVSHRDGDMIIGLVNIILFLVFRQPDGVMRSQHEDVISQMPQSITVAQKTVPMFGHFLMFRL